MFIRFKGYLFLVATILTIVAGCANDSKVYVEKNVETLYNSALNSLDARNFILAAREFEEVERQHPYSVWAIKAKLMAAYSNYQANKYDEAVIGLDRYIRLHPGNRDVPYAYYLKALSFYERISDVARDQKITEQALDSLTELVRRFPNSEYARDAKLKIDLTRDHLASKEMEIGRYYHNRGHYLAAINRFKRVVDDYQTTTHVPEALHRLVEAYTVLGISDEARKVAAVLGYNYPGSEWYVDTYGVSTGSDPLKKIKNEGVFMRTWNWLF